MTKAYLTSGNSYVRYDVTNDAVDSGYPLALGQGWSGLDGTGFESGVDAVLDLGTGKTYFFSGPNYLRADNATNQVDGEVRPIAGNWPGVAEAGFDALDAAINWGNGRAYLFRGSQYVRYDIPSDTVDDGPADIEGNWPCLVEAGFDAVDAEVSWGNGKVYFFRGSQYVRYDVAADAVDSEPADIAGNWPGVAEAGFGSIDAVWIRLDANAPTPPSPVPTPVVGGAPPGTYVWFWNGQVSTDKKIPRATWFPGCNPADENDYLGHGKEIYLFMKHSDGSILRGQPQMRSGRGSFAWLNRNPGNITEVKEGQGPDYGQYRGRLTWHNFLIFPSRDAGFAAIGSLLRGSGYRDLTIQAAFERYAPAKDGNDPVRYANDVAAAAGVPATTLVRDLDDAQLELLKSKIEQIEGSIPGDTLTIDSPELPDAVRQALA